MTSKSLTKVLAVVLTLGLTSAAMAAGSPSRSTRPAQPDNYSQGVEAAKAGNYQRALDSLQKVVRKEPQNADAWNYIGLSHRKLNNYDRSLEAYQKALSINPEHKGALEYLGELYLQIGKLEQAKAQLEKLDEVCGMFGCEEYDELKAAIEAYKSGKKTG